MLQNIQILVSQIIVMFLLIGVGAFCYRKKYINDDGAGQLSFILTRIVAPCVVIDSFQREFDPALGKALIISVLCTCTAMGLSILVSHLVFRKNGSHANFADKRFCVVFTNCGFMGLPLLDALYGSEGLFLGSAFIMVNNLLLWTYGVGQLSRDVPRAERLRNTFINPGVISNLIGLFCFLTPFKLPVVPATAVSYLASLNTPIAMIAVGAFLAQCDLRECFRGHTGLLRFRAAPAHPAAHHARGVSAPAARSHAALLHAHQRGGAGRDGGLAVRQDLRHGLPVLDPRDCGLDHFFCPHHPGDGRALSAARRLRLSRKQQNGSPFSFRESRFLFIFQKPRICDAERAEIHLRLIQAETVVLVARRVRVILDIIVDLPHAHRADIAPRGIFRKIRAAAGTWLCRHFGQKISRETGLVTFFLCVLVDSIRTEIWLWSPVSLLIFLIQPCFRVGKITVITQFRSSPGSDPSRTHRSEWTRS